MSTVRPPRAATALLLAVFLVAGCTGSASDEPRPGPWVPDRGDGRYTNPVLFADYSDPDVIRVGDDFYLTSSSFNEVPGLPILHSKDLVNWTLVGHAIERLPEPRFDEPLHGDGVWAPCLRYHDGWFWIFFGDPDAGIYMTKAQAPAGPWEPIHLVQAGQGLIDPSPLWDDDGNAYLVHAFARSRAHVSSILTLHRMSPDGSRLLDDGQIVYDGRNLVAPDIEGPKLYKRAGYYYILAPAGGVPDGWQLALRSRSPFGPFEAKRVLERGSTPINGPHQGGWVELASGESWFLHFQDRGPFGRVVHLEPVQWVDDWPQIGVDLDGNGVGEPVSDFAKPSVGGGSEAATPATTDELDSPQLGLEWQWEANPRDQWMSLVARRGWMRLFATPSPGDPANLWQLPNLLLQKFPAPRFSVTARLDVRGLQSGERAGLVIMGQAYSYLAAERTSSGCRLVKLSSSDASSRGHQIEEAETACGGDTIELRVAVDTDAACTFSHAKDGGRFTPIGQPFNAIAGTWIGAKVGLFCLAQRSDPAPGFADVDWFRVE